MTVMLFSKMVLSNFKQPSTSNLCAMVLVEKKESLAWAKVFIKKLLSGTAYVIFDLNDEYSSGDHMKLQDLYI